LARPRVNGNQNPAVDGRTHSVDAAWTLNERMVADPETEQPLSRAKRRAL